MTNGMHTLSVIVRATDIETGKSIIDISKDDVPLYGDLKKAACEVITSELGEAKTIFNGRRSYNLHFKIKATLSEPIEPKEETIKVKCSKLGPKPNCMVNNGPGGKSAEEAIIKYICGKLRGVDLSRWRQS